MTIWHVAPLRFAPAFRALGYVHIIGLLVYGTFGRHYWAETFVARNPGDKTSLPQLYRTDGKRPDGVTMIPWEVGKQLVWDVTVVDALAPSRLNQASLCNPGITAIEAEVRKIEKYRPLIDIGYIFQPVALEVQGSLGDSSEIFGICLFCRIPLSRKHRDILPNFFSAKWASKFGKVGKAVVFICKNRLLKL